jgi:hypothetical protein
MFVTRALRVAAGSIAAALVLTAVGTTAAQAKPVRPGPVTGLAATVTPHAAAYNVAASWNPATNATRYRVSVTRAGITLASGTVTATAWNGTVTAAPGDTTLSVRGLAKNRPGQTTSITVNLPDATPPSGSYSSSWSNNTGGATITQDSLTDNLPVDQVTRNVDWNDGTAPAAWTIGTTIDHTYPLTEQRYTPTVTLKDAAGNTTVVDVPAIVINDSQAPTGTFSAAPAAAWASLTHVTVTQSTLSDNWTPQAAIARSVDWGDGTTTPWASASTIAHVYTTGGTFTPTVTITDEAGNAAQVAASAVDVTVDSVAPVVKLLLPAKKHSVRAWKTLLGKATDTAGTGVKHVSLRAVEKRGTAWYAYRATTKTWVKASTKARAFARSTAFSLSTNGRHLWSARLVRLRKGTLVYKVWAQDKVANRSTTLTHKATLTRL